MGRQRPQLSLSRQTPSAWSASPPEEKTPIPPRVRPQNRPVRPQRLHPPHLQAGRHLGGQRHSPRSPQLGTRNHDKVRLPLRRQNLKRGQPLAQAKEIYRGKETDVQADSIPLNDAQGHHAILLEHALNFFETEVSLLTPTGAKLIALPLKSSVNGLLDNQIVVTLNQDWKPAGLSTTFPQGSVVSLDLDAVRKDSAHLRPISIFAPTAEEFAQDTAITRNLLLLTTLEHVQGRAWTFTHTPGGTWTRKKLNIPDNLAVSIETTNTSDDQFFLGLTGFLTPSSLSLGDASTATLKSAKTLPPQFDASKLLVEQLQATSTDGTKVPYFVVRRKDLKYDGSNPTVMTAYGGFQVSETPRYSGIIGNLWLNRGGVFVLANIRGGGEFGPAWHEAGLKTHRQRIYDDFASVGKTSSPVRSPHPAASASTAAPMAVSSWASNSHSTPRCGTPSPYRFRCSICSASSTSPQVPPG